MKSVIKRFLKRLRIYYFWQGRYRYFLSEVERINNKLRYFRYKGSGYRCNICGNFYSRFVPHLPGAKNKKAIESNHVIAGYGENIYCPSCASSARQRLVLAAIESRIDFKNKKILHFSPEKHVFNFLKSRAKIITADIEPGFYRMIDPQVVFADATQLPFKDGEFDIVIANHVLEHIPDDLRAMREFHRVLKKQGNAILQVPYSVTIPGTLEQPDIHDPVKQEALFGQKDHVRIYQLEDYLNRLRKSGFTVNIILPVDLAISETVVFQKEEVFISIVK